MPSKVLAIQNLVAASRIARLAARSKDQHCRRPGSRGGRDAKTRNDQLVAVLRAKLADPNFVSLLQAIISVVTGWVGQQNPVSNPSPAAALLTSPPNLGRLDS